MGLFGIKKKVKRLKERTFWQAAKPKIRRFLYIFISVVLFSALSGSAFALSWLFGVSFIFAFSLAIYHNELKSKPWRPLAVFVGALVTRFALEEYMQPIFTSETLLDLGVSAVVFLAIIIFAWKIKKA